jgi:VWFA-related protein
MLRRFAYTSGLILLCLAASARAQAPQTPAVSSPIYTGIVVDCSGSQRLQMDHVLSVIKQFVEAMQPGDEAFVVRFVDPAKTSVVQEFTGEKSDLIDAAEGLYVEAGQTSLFDAVDYSAKYLTKNKPASDGGTRSIILISSGDDRWGAKSADDTLALLKEQQVRVYAIGLSDLKVSTKSLDEISKESVGKKYSPRTTADLSNAVIDIVKLMRGAVGK